MPDQTSAISRLVGAKIATASVVVVEASLKTEGAFGEEFHRSDDAPASDQASLVMFRPETDTNFEPQKALQLSGQVAPDFAKPQNAVALTRLSDVAPVEEIVKQVRQSSFVAGLAAEPRVERINAAGQSTPPVESDSSKSPKERSDKLDTRSQQNEPKPQTAATPIMQQVPEAGEIELENPRKATANFTKGAVGFGLQGMPRAQSSGFESADIVQRQPNQIAPAQQEVSAVPHGASVLLPKIANARAQTSDFTSLLPLAPDPPATKQETIYKGNSNHAAGMEPTESKSGAVLKIAEYGPPAADTPHTKMNPVDIGGFKQTRVLESVGPKLLAETAPAKAFVAIGPSSFAPDQPLADKYDIKITKVVARQMHSENQDIAIARDQTRTSLTAAEDSGGNARTSNVLDSASFEKSTSQKDLHRHAATKASEQGARISVDSTESQPNSTAPSYKSSAVPYVTQPIETPDTHTAITSSNNTGSSVPLGVSLTDEKTALKVATTLTSDAPQRPFESPGRIVTQLAEGIRAPNNGSIEIKLSPEELGRVKLTLSPMEAGLSITVHAERPETMELIRRHIDLLAQDLRQQGHQNLSFHFGQNSSGSQNRQKAISDNGETSLATDMISETLVSSITPKAGVSGRLDLRL